MNANNQNAKQLFDANKVIEAVRLIVGEGNVTELRALEATTARDSWHRTISGYFDDPEKLAEALQLILLSAGAIRFNSAFLIRSAVKRLHVRR